MHGIPCNIAQNINNNNKCNNNNGADGENDAWEDERK
jgi:hypothetical protein